MSDLKEQLHLDVDISQKIKPHECEKLPLRWVVECILAWLGHSRCPSKDYEILSASENTMVKVSHIHTLVKNTYEYSF